MIGVALLLVGPYLGYRIGARVAPNLDRRTWLGAALGSIPGIATLAWSWWMPYAAAVMLTGATVGGIVATRRARSRDRELQTR